MGQSPLPLRDRRVSPVDLRRSRQAAYTAAAGALCQPLGHAFHR